MNATVFQVRSSPGFWEWGYRAGGGGLRMEVEVEWLRSAFREKGK